MMIQHLLNLFFPPLCAGCDEPTLNTEKVICLRCRHEIPLTKHLETRENEAFNKFYGKLDVNVAITFFYFNKKGIVQNIIHKLKYRGQQEIGSMLGEWFSAQLSKHHAFHDIDAVIPVPLHPKRLKERGYNQVTELSKALAFGLDASYNEKLLFRRIYSKTQTKKGRSERTGVASFFDVEYTKKDIGKHYLLVDDVITTGSTLQSCGNALLKIPDTKVSIVCIAYSS